MNLPEKDSFSRPDPDTSGDGTGGEQKKLLNPDSPVAEQNRVERIVEHAYPAVVRFIARDYMARLGEHTYIAGIKIPFMDSHITVTNPACTNPRGTFIGWKCEVDRAKKIIHNNRDSFEPKIMMEKFTARSVLNYDVMFRWVEKLVINLKPERGGSISERM
jgi:hypothetical protein